MTVCVCVAFIDQPSVCLCAVHCLFDMTDWLRDVHHLSNALSVYVAFKEQLS